MYEDCKDDPIEQGELGKYFPKIFEAFSHTADGKYEYIIHLQKDYAYWSEEAAEYFGLPSNRTFDAIATWAELVCPEDREAFHKDLNDLLEGRTKEHFLTYRVRNRAGEFVTCTCRGRIICDDTGEKKYMAGTVVNHQIAETVDPVTGLYNIHHLFEHLVRFRERERPYYLLMTGVKDFFDINASYGYDFGNRILQKIAETLRTVAESGMIFRTEGTKIVLLFSKENVTIEGIRKKYDFVVNRVRERLTIGEKKISIGLEACLFITDTEKMDAGEVYNNAFFALEKVKQAKISELLIVDNKAFEGNLLHLSKLNHIRDCILDNFSGFYLRYQPVIDATSGEMSGMEALLRWRGEPYGEVGPSEFIEWLERDPLFYELGKWIITRALQDVKRILEDNPDFVVNINLSYTQLQNVNLKEDLLDIIRRSGVPCKNIEFEITERCKLIDMESLKHDIGFLKKQGIRIALDDLGTGYSALDLMVELPIDMIKIDRSLIMKLDEDRSRQSLLRAITACAKELEKRVCIEGIESEGLASFIRKNFYATDLQGYFFSKPVPIEAVVQKQGKKIA